jgi:DNA-binding transcriptional regulator LsrR (DeoR family)
MNSSRKPDGGYMANDDTNTLIREIQSVKMLLILQAMASGCQQKHVAAALGISEATLSRMLPKGFGKELAKVAERRHASAAEAK